MEGTINVPTRDHGPRAHPEYSKRVGRILDDYYSKAKTKGRNLCKCLTEADAQRMLKWVEKSDDPYIQGFLEVVGGGDAAVEEWALTKGSAILNRESQLLARGGVLRYGKYLGRVVAVVIVANTVYYASENGAEAAAIRTLKDFTFYDEINGSTDWMNDKFDEMFDSVRSWGNQIPGFNLQKRCKLNDPDLDTDGLFD